MRRAVAYGTAVAAPAAFTEIVSHVAGWPKPYSWQYLGITILIAVVAGVGPGLVSLAVALAAVIWLGVPTPLHPGAEMFAAVGLAVIALLDRWRRTEAELTRQSAALREANEQLRDEDRRKNDFIAVLSHELRNPLAPIRYALPLIEAEPHGPAAARALQIIHRQIDHVTRLVDDLLDVSRIARDRIELRRSTVPLASILTAAADAASPAIAAARHEFHLELPDEPLWIDADGPRLAQVVTNLLNNAARYTERGGRIEMRAARDGDRAVIRVRDNGIGIPPESLTSIFDMFRQLNRAHNSPHQEGLGIGLGLARRLVELHGGTIEAHSAGHGHGAEFVVRLPLTYPADESSDTSAAEPSPRAPVRLKVLVVDDNADLVEMLATIVEMAGHEVRKALDGRSAIAAALAYRPDVVLLDLGLPVVGGLEVARELRQSEKTRSTRLVALTGWGQREDRARTAEAGFDYHLTKPTDPRQLRALLDELASGDGGNADAQIGRKQSA